MCLRSILPTRTPLLPAGWRSPLSWFSALTSKAYILPKLLAGGFQTLRGQLGFSEVTIVILVLLFPVLLGSCIIFGFDQYQMKKYRRGGYAPRGRPHVHAD